MQDFVALVRQSKICIWNFFCVVVFFCIRRPFVFIHCYWLVHECVYDVFFTSFLHCCILIDFHSLSQCRQFLCLLIYSDAVFFISSLVENYTKRSQVWTRWIHSQCELEKKKQQRNKKLDHLKISSFSLLFFAWLYHFFLTTVQVHCTADQGYFSQFSVHFALTIRTFCVTIVFGNRTIACNESPDRKRARAKK